MATTLKYWAEAATLIIAARSKAPIISYLGSKKLSFDYQILMLQRTAKASVFPSAQVFPGGTIDRADLSPGWLDVFKKYANVHSTADFGRMVNVQGERPPMLLRDRQSPLPIDVACRICAIRETFEESGILLVRETAEDRDTLGGFTLGRPVTLSYEDRKRWREMVHDDAGQFLSLCRELRCFPDIWSLAEWANWLTPADHARRFDTMFYISCLDSLPDAIEDKSEIDKSKWVSPLQSLQMHANAEEFIAPPQLYESRRLLRFENFDKLCEFSRKRAFKGTLQFFTVLCDIEDGLVAMLPGDEDYPAKPKEETTKGQRVQREESCAASFSSGKVTNRIVWKDLINYDLLNSSPPACGHVAPLTDRIPATKEDTKL